MGKIIRRIITITITETWTMVWATDDEPAHQATTTVQDPSNTQEEPDEALQVPVIAVETAAPPPTPAAALDPQPNDLPTRPAASGRSRRTHRREVGSTQQSD